MKLTIFERVAKKKSDASQLRRQGKIPAALHAKGRSPQTVSVQNDEFQAVLRHLKAGLLPTTVFELHFAGKVSKAIIKEVQYHPATYAVEHIDFLELQESVPVVLNVPIVLTGIAECAGVKLGGTLRQIIRQLQVRCLPKDIPQSFSLDVKEMEITHKKTLADLAIPSTVRPLAKLSEVVVVIGKLAAA